MNNSFDKASTSLGEFREGHLDIYSEEFEDRIEFYITDGLGNYSVVKIKVKDKAELEPFTTKSAWVEIERYKQDLEENEEYERKENKHSVEHFLFDIRSID